MTSQSDFDELREVVQEEVGRTRVPGFALGLLLQAEEFTAGFGVTNLHHPLPVDADTLFQIGSITKTFTATAAMRLVDEGRLDLDAPVRQYLPDLRLVDAVAQACVTPRHLLTHTAGWIGDYFCDTGRGDDALARYVAELADVEQLTPPGALYSYCNSGFSMLGRVIEILTGATFETALQHLVLEPLDLERSFLFPEDVMTHRFAVGHANVRDQLSLRGRGRSRARRHRLEALRPASANFFATRAFNSAMAPDQTANVFLRLNHYTRCDNHLCLRRGYWILRLAWPGTSDRATSITAVERWASARF
jgi:CubicO group peptidase (beta-lactamase class C family)